MMHITIYVPLVNTVSVWHGIYFIIPTSSKPTCLLAFYNHSEYVQGFEINSDKKWFTKIQIFAILPSKIMRTFFQRKFMFGVYIFFKYLVSICVFCVQCINLVCEKKELTYKLE